jgi:hypothetical protein
MCDSGCVEDIEHLIMSCEAYSQPRLKMLAIVGFDPECRSQSDKLDILLGKSTGNSGVDDSIDIAVKRFLKKAWRARKWLVVHTNKTLERNDTPWAIYAHGDGLTRSYLKHCEAPSAA